MLFKIKLRKPKSDKKCGFNEVFYTKTYAKKLFDSEKAVGGGGLYVDKDCFFCQQK